MSRKNSIRCGAVMLWAVAIRILNDAVGQAYADNWPLALGLGAASLGIFLCGCDVWKAARAAELLS
jgi:hypothetical protein